MIPSHLSTITSHHAGWCYHLVLINIYLLLGIYHVDIGSITSYHIILRLVMLWFNKIKAWEVWYKICFVLHSIDLFSRQEICLLTMPMNGMILLLRRCLRYRNMKGRKIHSSEKIVRLCTGNLLRGL